MIEATRQTCQIRQCGTRQHLRLQGGTVVRQRLHGEVGFPACEFAHEHLRQPQQRSQRLRILLRGAPAGGEAGGGLVQFVTQAAPVAGRARRQPFDNAIDVNTPARQRGVPGRDLTGRDKARGGVPAMGIAEWIGIAAIELRG